MVRNYGFLPVFYEASGKPRPATVRTKDHVESNSAPCFYEFKGYLGLSSITMSEGPPGRWQPAPAPPPPEREYQPIHPGSGRGNWRERLKNFFGPIIAAIALLATKLKAVLLLLPKVKLLTTSGTMLVSIAAYALFWGWPFAVGFVLLLLVHEMGHVIQLRREGIEASAPMFIPFLGAVVAAKSMGDDAAAEARVGLAGPVLGSIACLVPLAIYFATGDDFWRALALIGFFLNLFNLAPVTPLDGGRAVAALTPWMWFLGLFLVGVLAFTYPNPIIFLILIMGAFDVHRRWKARHAQADYYKVSPRNRAIVAVVYLGLIVALAVGLDMTHVARTLSDV